VDKITLKYSTYANALPPQPIRVKTTGGWAGLPQKMVDGSEPQPWHCLPFVEGATHGLELVYPYETECHVINDNGDIKFEFDYAKEPGNILTGGEFITFFPKEASKFYLFNTRLDIVPPPDHVLRTEPHPRFFTDDTGTVPVALCGHVQNEWWPRKLFVVFKVPPPGQRHIFRKGEPYVQLLAVPHGVKYEATKLDEAEEARRRKLETEIDAAKAQIAENRWHNNAGNEFSDYYKMLARAYQRDGLQGVEGLVKEALVQHEASLPKDKPVADALAQGRQRLNEGKYDEAKAIYQHVLSKDPNNAEALSHLGIVAACTGQPMVGLKMMSQAVSLQPREPLYHSNLGEMLRMMGRFQEAEGAFRGALQLSPRDTVLMSTLGLTIAQQGRTEEGLQICRAALAVAPSAGVHYRVGLILAQQKQFKEARAAYDAALAADPSYIHARDAIRQLPAEART
jgi:tetratricopeptide (TPR) repeat protein